MVAQPKVSVTRISPNRSSRNGAKIRVIVLHSTEGPNLPGVADLQNLGGWFAQRSAGVSCAVATDAEGNSGRYVADADKAWHCANANAYTLGIEQVGYSSQKTWPEAQLQATAEWVAYWSVKYGIPLVRSTSHGVCTHKDLGVAGGNHGDPGAGYHVEAVLARAKAIVVGKAAPTGYAALTVGERDAVDDLLYERRVKYRHGGHWANVSPGHRQRAVKAADWLRDRRHAIASGSGSRRPARRAYITRVLTNGSMIEP